MSDEEILGTYEFNPGVPYPPCTCGRSATEYCEKRECDFSEEEWIAKQNESAPEYVNFNGIVADDSNTDVYVPPQ